nr:hypothetical protein [Tanacetum cinerariifolium]
MTQRQRLLLYLPLLQRLSQRFLERLRQLLLLPHYRNTYRPDRLFSQIRPEADPKESPEEDPSEDDSSGDDTLKAAGPLAVQAVPPPLQIKQNVNYPTRSEYYGYQEADRSCWIGKMVQEDGICVPHQQSCHQFSSEVCYTLLDSVLTWQNSHVKTVGIDIAYEMS